MKLRGCMLYIGSTFHPSCNLLLVAVIDVANYPNTAVILRRIDLALQLLTEASDGLGYIVVHTVLRMSSMGTDRLGGSNCAGIMSGIHVGSQHFRLAMEC